MYNRLLNNWLYICKRIKGSEKLTSKVKKLDMAFKKYHTMHHEIIDGKFREYGLGFGQPPILKYLSDHENVTQKEIADHLNITQPAVAKALKKSESTIKQLFSTYRSDGIISYYNRLKIDEAKKDEIPSTKGVL
jgi:hypothetical protein